MNGMRYIITKYGSGVLAFVFDARTNRMDAVSFVHSDKNTDNITIGDIFVAKVKNVVRQLNAAFIDYMPDQKGYLPIPADYSPILTNRRFDGRILAGDEILVQLEKEAVRTKEPVFTANLSLAGKYSVISCGNTYKGVSKKCSRSERERLRNVIPQDIDYGVVIRTNAASLLHDAAAILPDADTDFDAAAATDTSQDELQTVSDEIRYLCSKMSTLIQDGSHRTCYSRISHAAPPYLTSMRDAGIVFERIVTDDAQIFDEIKEFAAVYLPEQLAGISLYQDETYPLNKLYRVETQLDERLSKKVWLRSGAYLIIEKTEAMYVVDVNSGKNISKKDSAAYIYQINLEAACEIMYQIRLRNLTGMILVDFINMENSQKDEALLQELRSLAKKDHIQTNIVDMTALGLVEITRKKTMRSLAEQLRDL